MRSAEHVQLCSESSYPLLSDHPIGGHTGPSEAMSQSTANQLMHDLVKDLASHVNSWVQNGESEVHTLTRIAERLHNAGANIDLPTVWDK